MTKEALKLALEALEVANSCVDGYYIPKGKTHLPEIEEAITAIKESLANEALEKMAENARELGLDYEPEQEPVTNGKLKVTLQDTPTEIELSQYKRMLYAACADLGAINDALGLDPNDGGAEPILLAIEELKGRLQEPMAWMVYTLDGTSVCVTDNPSSFTPEHRALPLYTTPPQRTWVGLTDEEINSVRYKRDWTGPWTDMTFARAIESKLRSKNEGKT